MASCDFDTSSENSADFILRYSRRSIENLRESTGDRCIDFINNDFAIIHVPLEQIINLSIAAHSYSAIPKLYGLLDTTAVEESGISAAQHRPVLNADGHGVLLGIIDTGIDYTSPLFIRADGQSRILELWDQTLPTDQATFTQEAITAALRAEDPYGLVPSQDTNGHGTFMAGIAAGSRLETPVSFVGAAPETLLGIVKLRPAKPYLRDFFLIRSGAEAYQENDIMTAIRYLIHLADQHQLPLVIYLGVGTAQGSHDGTSPLGLQLSSYNGYPGLAIVTGAGNETGWQHHYFATLAANQPYEDVELLVGEDETGFCAELWATMPELFTVGFVSPSGEVISRISLALGQEAVIPFRLEATRITINYVNYEAGAGTQLIFLRFASPTPGIWHIRVYPSQEMGGSFHIWLPMHGFLSEQTTFLRPEPDTTITDPGNVMTTVTAACYDHVNGRIDIHSSRGFTRLGQVKPDIAAPGVNVQGPLLPLKNSTGSEADLRFGRLTGTSVSAALTAGAMADLFSWAIVDGNAPTLSGTAAAAMLIRGASRSSAHAYPDRSWGYGTLDLYQAFRQSGE
ncbi:MAG: S8 family peptidase [Clostridiales bacterium]|nr:S8 family peptidase [Clostridiales bacterium]